MAELKLETAPDTARAASGVIGVKTVITEVANCASRGEKGDDVTCPILTLGDDQILTTRFMFQRF